MINIHSNLIMPLSFNKDSIVEDINKYSLYLEEASKDCKKLASFLKEKNIKIINSYVDAISCRFAVDDIDAGLLKQASCISENDPSKDRQFFYTDPILDKFIEKSEKDLEEFSSTTKDSLTLIKEVNFDEDEIFTEQHREVQLKDIFVDSEEEDDIVGVVDIEVNKIDDDRFAFNLAMADLSDYPSEVDFDREKSMFKYKCKSCDDWHYESLNSIYNSLRTTNALLSNLIVMCGEKYKEFGIALDLIDYDLRLLQILLETDYALDSTQNTIEFDDLDEEEDE